MTTTINRATPADQPRAGGLLQAPFDEHSITLNQATIERGIPRRRWVRRLAEETRGAPAPAVASAVDEPAARRPSLAVTEVVDHLSLGVNDLAHSKLFYDATLAPLGVAPHVEQDGESGYFRTTDHLEAVCHEPFADFGALF